MTTSTTLAACIGYSLFRIVLGMAIGWIAWH